MYLGGGVVCVEDDAEVALLVVEEGMVAGTHKSLNALKNRVLAALAPGTVDLGGIGIAHTVFGTLIVVGRVGEIIALHVFHHEGTFTHAAHHLLPVL